MKTVKRRQLPVSPSKVIAFPASRRVRPAMTGSVQAALSSAITPLLSGVAASASALHALRELDNPSNLVVVSAAQHAMDENIRALKAVLDGLLSLELSGGAA